MAMIFAQVIQKLNQYCHRFHVNYVRCVGLFWYPAHPLFRLFLQTPSLSSLNLSYNLFWTFVNFDLPSYSTLWFFDVNSHMIAWWSVPKIHIVLVLSVVAHEVPCCWKLFVNYIIICLCFIQRPADISNNSLLLFCNCDKIRTFSNASWHSKFYSIDNSFPYPYLISGILHSLF